MKNLNKNYIAGLAAMALLVLFIIIGHASGNSNGTGAAAFAVAALMLFGKFENINILPAALVTAGMGILSSFHTVKLIDQICVVWVIIAAAVIFLSGIVDIVNGENTSIFPFLFCIDAEFAALSMLLGRNSLIVQTIAAMILCQLAMTIIAEKLYNSGKRNIGLGVLGASALFYIVPIIFFIGGTWAITSTAALVVFMVISFVIAFACFGGTVFLPIPECAVEDNSAAETESASEPEVKPVSEVAKAPKPEAKPAPVVEKTSEPEAKPAPVVEKAPEPETKPAPVVEKAPEPEPETEPETEDTWTCPECGHDGNTLNFCGKCGSAKPMPEPKPKLEPEPEKWTCPNCGKEDNELNFCGICGMAKPMPEPEPEPEPPQESKTWTCPNCGKDDNELNFCLKCGTPKPLPPKKDEPWICPKCGVEMPGKFCGICGGKRPE